MIKLFGYEINQAKKATSPSPVASVSLVKNLQKTEPSRPLRSSNPRADLGDSGTRLLHGIITEEYNPQLQGIQGIKVFDEMRKGDGTVRAAMLACTLPIRRAEWFVNPATESEQDKEISNFVSKALFNWLDLSWDDIIRQALLMVVFGVMVFEKVYGVKEHDGKSYVTLSKLAPRLPKSILQWELVDHTFGIQQIRQDGVLAQIPGSKMLVFVNEREGDNWWGMSMLRAAYPHWYYKKHFYSIDGIAFERQGMGIPTIYMPTGYTEADELKAETALANLRASEKSYLVLPNEYKAEFLNMGASSTRDPEKSINHHNKEILQSVLAQFLELGATKTGSGSHALSQDHSDLFLKGMEAIANTIQAEFNKNLIPELVDLNFNNVKVYPVLDYSGIIRVDVQALGDAYSKLVSAGAITPTNDDQQYLRVAMGLPPRSQEDIDAEDDQEPDTERQEDHADIEGGSDDLEDSMDKNDTKPQTKDQNKKTDTTVKKKTAHEHKALARTFDDGKGFKSWRPLTFAEKKVDWTSVQSVMDKMEASFSKEAIDQLRKAKDALLAKIHDAMNRNAQAEIAILELQFQNTYSDLLKSAMKKAYTYGKNMASGEMGIEAPSNMNDSMTNINLMADTIASKTASDIESKAKLTIANHIKQNTSILTALGSLDVDLQKLIEKGVQQTAGIIVGQNINTGRFDVFKRNSAQIQSLQRSEVLDERTCDFCISMDGLVVAPGDSWASTDIFHGNCRGIWVEILNDEQDAPEITGVPEEVGQYFGGQVNQLIQPPKPITRPGSSADKYVKKQEAKKSK